MNQPELGAQAFFLQPQNPVHRQYEALRAFFVEQRPAEEIAARFGYTVASIYSLVRDFKQRLPRPKSEIFFVSRSPGRKPKDSASEISADIVALRKKYLSVPDIKAVLDGRGIDVSERYIGNVIKAEGFDRLPRRSIQSRNQTFSSIKVEAARSEALDLVAESFASRDSLGVLSLLPYLERHGIDRLISKSRYPLTKATSRLSSIMCFLGLKLSNVRRYTADDVWCMDRGLGLFACRNVLPKAAWFTSYSSRVTRKMNVQFLRGLHKIWTDAGLLSDTANLDFAAIPYWGDASHLENNWSGTRHRGLPSILAVLAQEPDSGIITYSDTSIRHCNKSKVVLEFLDFYRSGDKESLKYLVFDSKFTTYENLARLDPKIKFITIRRRGKKIVDELRALPSSAWQSIRVPAADGKGRALRVNDSQVQPPQYGSSLRQVAIEGHGRIKPALLITNDLDIGTNDLVRKYARRWIVEKGISEQIEFFHLNKISSSMVIKVDFDLTMSVLAHNILRVFALDLPGYSHCTSLTLYNKFLRNSGTVEITDSDVVVRLKKKRNLPAVLTAMHPFQRKPLRLLGERRFSVLGDTTS
jgi:hypothetical protein